MKRKTNLFYTNGPDSKFITFSNYTECLTGNFLSLETKLFPDKFLCLKINNLNAASKPLFIKYIAAYYENKLAMLRDNNIKSNLNIESNILPLAYLLEAIIRVCKIDDSGNWVLDYNDNTDPESIGKLNKLISGAKQDVVNENIENDDDYIEKIQTASRNLITYIGEVTEQDYNGTYTDTICTIDLNAYNEGELLIDATTNYSNYGSASTSNLTKLYGWENDNIIFEDYNNIKPIYDIYDSSDGTGEYSYMAAIDQDASARTLLLSQLKLVPINQNSVEYNDKTLEFNIIIPLFSLVNKNISHQDWNMYEVSEDNSYKYIDLINKTISTTSNYIYNVPLGMWINGDGDDDTFIKLEKDPNLKLYPSWSLLISSQFKPFPYSNKLEENNRTVSMSDAHATYAEVLTKINSLFDEFSRINEHIHNLEDKINRLDSNIKNIATENNISDINEKLLSTESRVLDELDDMKRKFYGYINNVTWSSAG